ncbi:MAG: translation initiation factor IF-2 [Nitrospiraceae bacterium]
MRVYEVAKKVGMESKELMAELKRMGVPVASHSSALEADVVARLLSKLTPQQGQGGPSGDEKGGARAGRGGEGFRQEADGGGGHVKSIGAKAGAASVEEPPKPDKRRILIKKKKTEEEIEAAATATVESGVMPVPPPDLIPPGPGLPTAEPPAPAPSLEAKPDIAVSPPSGMLSPAPAGSPMPTAPIEAKLSVSVTPVLDAASEAALAKKKAEALFEGGEAKGAREKAKKVRKPGRERDEEEARAKEDAARWDDLRAISVHRRDDRVRHAGTTPVTEITKPRKKGIKLTAGMTVKEFAEAVGQRPADIMKKLMESGQMLTLNQSMNLELAGLIAEELGVKVEVTAPKAGEELLEEAVTWKGEEKPEPRPPVVTIMGHVDHGKTSLLDAIRQTKVAEQEAGGITQHIGAYSIELHGKRITFLDTPGHEAFTAMRARGAKVTDIVILVVAADDGVMPQTMEAINHATAANVPIVVAINKIDKPEANVERVKHALAEHNLISEAWGGQTIMVEVSAKKRQNLDLLLEMVLLQADVLELRADPNKPAKGTVIEAKLDRGRGPVATVLVQEGTLKVGDTYVVGTYSGRVRALIPAAGGKLTEAGPSMAVGVVGLTGVPSAGDTFMVVKDERMAREIAESRAQKQRAADLAGPAKVSLDDLYARIKQGDIKELALVIKADVQGSSEALAVAIDKLPSEVVKLRIIHNGVGGITETDVLLAAASGAIVIGFNVRPESKAAALAESERVDLRLYSVIYDAIADIKAAMEGLLEPTFKERVLGRAEVRQVFNVSKAGIIAGCYVLEGSMTRTSSGVRVVRDHVPVYQGKLGSLRRFKDDVREVQQGYECGIGVENFSDIKAGDIIENFVLDRIAAKL